MSKQNKFALITGGSRGIGKAICIQLAKDTDYEILINYNTNENAALETLKKVEAVGGSGQIIQFDVSNFESVQKALNAWQEQQSDAIIEVLVNNAGITKDGLFMWMKPQEWNDVINTSLNGFFNVTNLLIEKMLLNRYGRIINMVSISGLKGVSGQTNYSAAKGAVIAATKSLSQEVAKRNVTVNAVAPGFIETDMTEDLDEASLKKMIPANRFGKPEEVAHLVSFLVSKNASYITGEIIGITGGIH
ncbi:3-oxoacyl-[acyl-carrier protein] reductase [Gelidibacter sediminis]|uniref:3-oxoacyl-[acyl-carrier protein] reductase n=1 Tax=Gelidibacter sediminis TaxID=1608710 RepID=A0A4R7Q733_9FLAO|nr:3-oxoacyl-ACP reductase FabG [Gelidibacter sediminis]TDU43437.1 3-oxoacyl-[acyl-carrier protein] reductase [Gelidibacter sediminis]